MVLASYEAADTIVAISTPAGVSWRGIVRMSGPRARELASRVFVEDAGRSLCSLGSYSSCAGTLVLEKGAVRLPALLYVMLAPRSYTREDITEIHTIGAPVVLKALAEELIALGGRLAQPGELTRRAFLNGRIDLTQAEAVVALIRSRTDAESRRAISQLGGALSGEIASLGNDIVDLLALLELDIDFSDQDVELMAPGELLEKLERVRAGADAAYLSAVVERAPKTEVATVIYGVPNVGKSTLFNALLSQDRSVVSHIPGTTRDAVEDIAHLGGISFRLIDTAGLGYRGDALGEEAARRAEAATRACDLPLLVLNGSRQLLEEELCALEVAPPYSIVVVSKKDLGSAWERLPLREGLACVRTSSVTGEGLAELKELMVRRVTEGEIDLSAPSFLLSVRQLEAFGRARANLADAANAARSGMGPEFVALHLRECATVLGELTGSILTEEVLDRIFAEFCIGK